MNQDIIDNFKFNGPLLRDASRGLWNEMNFLVHGLASEAVGDDVFIYKVERGQKGEISLQKILGWVNQKPVKFEDEPIEDAECVRTSEGKAFFCLGDRLLTRVVR